MLTLCLKANLRINYECRCLLSLSRSSSDSRLSHQEGLVKRRVSLLVLPEDKYFILLKPNMKEKQGQNPSATFSFINHSDFSGVAWGNWGTLCSSDSVTADAVIDSPLRKKRMGCYFNVPLAFSPKTWPRGSPRGILTQRLLISVFTAICFIE